MDPTLLDSWPRLVRRIGVPVMAAAAIFVVSACSSDTTAVSTVTSNAAGTTVATTTPATTTPATTATGNSYIISTTSSPPSTGDATVTLAKRFAGTYSGTWTNKTFNSTGTVKTVITIDESAKTFTATTTLTGNVFGAVAPGPIKFTLDLTKLGAGATTKTDFFGDVTVTVAPDLTVTFEALKVPSTRVTSLKSTIKLDGAGKLSGTYDVGLADGTKANGVTDQTKA